MTRFSANMKNKLMSSGDKLLLRERGLIESVHNRLKNGAQIQYHRHRSPWNFLVNLLTGLTLYEVNPVNPGIVIEKELLSTL